LRGGGVGDLEGERKGECLDEEWSEKRTDFFRGLGLLAILKKE